VPHPRNPPHDAREDNRAVVERATVALTTHRLIAIAPSQRFEAPLSRLADPRAESPLFGSARILLTLTAPDGPLHVLLKFYDGGRDGFLSELLKALAASAWKQSSRPATVVAAPSAASAAPGGGGMAAILKTMEDATAERARTITTAFSDIDLLMKQARDIVDVPAQVSYSLGQVGRGDPTGGAVGRRRRGRCGDV
jgi:hypothetical protein